MIYDINIRKLKKDEISSIMDMAESFCAASGLPKLNRAVYAENCASIIDSGGAIFIAENNEPIGGISIMMNSDLYDGMLNAIVTGIYLKPAFRGFGLGKKLLKTGLDFSRGSNAKRFFAAYQIECMDYARNLFNSFGMIEKEVYCVRRL